MYNESGVFSHDGPTSFRFRGKAYHYLHTRNLNRLTTAALLALISIASFTNGQFLQHDLSLVEDHN